MEEENFKWYSPFVLLVGAILSFADPITDILTLVEFYRADHITWFGVGLTFVLFPCLVFPVGYWMLSIDPHPSCARTALCALHPFSAALARLEALFHCLKNWWYKDEIDSHSDIRARDVFNYIFFAVTCEAVLECAPQFVIQLYAIIVQEEPAAIIQIISLPISFLTLAWAFTATDKMFLVASHIVPSSSYLNVKHQLALYATHLLLLSSRLFAICYFTVSYKWWVIGVLMVHCCVMVIAAVIQYRDKLNCDASNVFLILIFMGFHSLRDEFVNIKIGTDVNLAITWRVYLSHILFVLENFFMILMFYFTYHSNAWYSLPVTVCVCVFSVLGSTMRICLLRWLSKRPAEQLSSCDDSSNVNASVEKCYESSV